LSKDHTRVAAGTRVRIAAVVGTRVVVEPIAGPSPATDINLEDAT
jgi:hypothetical protein